ncbi:MAG: hypothetical protein KKG09_04150 [Verrucomicrobia bacterium]|nr:hypothetical protein [Verrucomicrobiota bacterium]MCG2680450.1 hypothetical protein [Kiritimatiellia bacterium]MBU4247551.1 hypothetical protein [Verrucomicrobiota bacterium]MBU4291261.1 hypothetical protein [Verrucomicrobiota bacterium]MBU4428987.1 hypothetical protein [Verrucomicrobiota bacterium]
MDVEIFTLCDAATETAGKLNILGTFDRIITRQLPTIHPHCAIALRVRFDRIEEGEHRVKINLVDDDGQSVFPGLDGNISVKMPPEGMSVCANLILNLNGLKFPKPGQYAIDLAIDGRQEKSLPVFVALIEQKS